MARELTEEEQSKLDELREQHGSVAMFLVAGDLVVVRPPKPAEHDRLVDKLTSRKKDASTASAQREFALACICYPEDSGKKREILGRRAGLAVTIADRASDLAAEDVEELEGN